MAILNKSYFHAEEAAFARLEAIVWPDGPVCPHCGSMHRTYPLKGVRSKASKKHPDGIVRLGLKKCGACRKQFTVRVGTIFEDSHVPLHKWFQAIHLLCSSKKGISSHQLHRTLEIQYKSAWHMSHRIREIMRMGALTSPLGGNQHHVVEVDETYFAKKKDVPVKRGGHAHKQTVLTLRPSVP